jgi:peptide/nickel transport system substrate-binding protein
MWLTPENEPFTIDLQAAPDENDAFRIANAAADMWNEFGINVELQGLERSVWDQNRFVGQYDISVPWMSFALANGDAWPNVRGWHSDYYIPNGEDYRASGGANQMRLQDPALDGYIEQMAVADPDSQENIDINTEFLKYWTENMYFITAISFKKFVTWDERYWTGFPTSENPDYQPLYWFQGGRFAFQNLQPVS